MEDEDRLDGLDDECPALVISNLPVSDGVVSARILLHEPDDDQIFTRSIRRIFHNTPLSEQELAWLRSYRQFEQLSSTCSTFRNMVRQSSHGLRRSHTKLRLRLDMTRAAYTNGVMDKELLRVLQHVRGDPVKTQEFFGLNLQFRSKYKWPLVDTDMLEDLKSGFCYWHGRDLKNRPCLVMRVAKIPERLSSNPDRLVKVVLFCCEWCIRYALLPGRVEEWVTIIDLDGGSLRSFSVSSITQMVRAMSQLYRYRSVRTIITNPPMLARSIYNMIAVFIPQDTRDSTLFGCPQSELVKYFHPSQVEEKFGGSATNVIESYPYVFPNLPEDSIVPFKITRRIYAGAIMEDTLNCPNQLKDLHVAIAFGIDGICTKRFAQYYQEKGYDIRHATCIEDFQQLCSERDHRSNSFLSTSGSNVQFERQRTMEVFNAHLKGGEQVAQAANRYEILRNKVQHTIENLDATNRDSTFRFDSTISPVSRDSEEMIDEKIKAADQAVRRCVTFDDTEIQQKLLELDNPVHVASVLVDDDHAPTGGHPWCCGTTCKPRQVNAISRG